ncbi:MAG: SUMF1/EgtB/PvdO family nonheme iron enzyme [Candidatus Cloacimonetes bacterium]|nr:SUMF1/EgtB/PvdO family nonheme iron enzyme [Candidatus Cloacimonadota bacterium]
MEEGLQTCYSFPAKDSVKCNWSANGYRLPTEAEWEYAASSVHFQSFKEASKFLNEILLGRTETPNNIIQQLTPQMTDFVGSDIIDEVATHRNNRRRTSAVGQKLANQSGIYDMSGNVFEWCWDWYDKNYYRHSTLDNPLGAKQGVFKIARGGSWKSSEYFCRTYARYSAFPDFSIDKIGFRMVRGN